MSHPGTEKAVKIHWRDPDKRVVILQRKAKIPRLCLSDDGAKFL